MIESFMTYTARTRQIILVAIAFLICYGVYQLSIKKTVNAYQKWNAYGEMNDPTNGQQMELKKLKQELATMHQEMGIKNKMTVTNTTLLVASENQIASLDCRVYALPKRIEDKGERFTYGISELILEGSFKELVQGLSNIEQSAIGSHLVSSRFSLNENWASQKKELLLHLIFKQVKNEE